MRDLFPLVFHVLCVYLISGKRFFLHIFQYSTFFNHNVKPSVSRLHCKKDLGMLPAIQFNVNKYENQNLSCSPRRNAVE